MKLEFVEVGLLVKLMCGVDIALLDGGTMISRTFQRHVTGSMYAVA
jgi:hypothetical protein